MEVCPGIYALDSTRRSYAYLILGDPAILVDTSMPGSAEKILEEIRTLGISPRDISHIVLTHHDIDHIGSAAALRKATGAKLWASAGDLPFIEGRQHRPGIKRMVEIMMRADTPEVDAVFDNHDAPMGLTVVPTPGHTPGHVAFLYNNVLFAGDMVMVRGNALRPSPGIITWNTTLLRDSIDRTAALPFDWICPAHGQPMQRGDSWDTLTRTTR